MQTSYLEMMRAHVDDGGRLSHRNGLDLLEEVKELRAVLAHLQEALDRILPYAQLVIHSTDDAHDRDALTLAKAALLKARGKS